MKGPAIFLAQFAGDEAPFNSLEAIARWAGDLGYKGVQIPTWVWVDNSDTSSPAAAKTPFTSSQ